MNKKIKILYLIDQIATNAGGSEQHLSFLLKYLPKESFEIHLALLRDTGYYDPEHYPVKPIFINFKSFNNSIGILRAVRKIRRLISEYKIDVVHTFFPDSELLGLISSKLSRRCTLVAARRNMGFRYSQTSLWRTRFFDKFIPHYLCNCMAIKEQIIQIEHVPENKIEVIYNPLVIKRIEGGIAEKVTRRDLGVGDNEFLIGIVANLRPIKDHETFLKAARLILDQRPEVQFILIGKGSSEYTERLKLLIKDLDLDSSVIFQRESENPASLMKLCDLGVLTSKSEGLSNALIEYGAIGLPTVATNAGGNPEVVIDGKTGFIVPPSSPDQLAARILPLIDDDEMRRRFGENARKFVSEKFRQESIITAYKNYYCKIAGNY